MGSTDTAFAGSVPALYDSHMVPLLFRPYAELVAERARAFAPRRILETAAGTGVVTQALEKALPEAEIVATDLNQAMLDIAAERVRSPKVQFRQADALTLPFDDASFDLVVCQFGIMFYPDKVAGNREAKRVLSSGGRYLLVIWDKLEKNLASKVASEAAASLFPDAPSTFYKRVPFGYHDLAAIEHDLLEAGFTDIEVETVERRSRLPSARDAAVGLVQGTPLRAEIEQSRPDLLGPATDAAEQALRRFEGQDGFDAPMSAHLVIATA